MGAELGRISGPLLSANLLRNGVDLAFETDLLYLNVVDGYIGVKTDTPTRQLNIDGTASVTELLIDSQADFSNISIVNNTIQNVLSPLYIKPNPLLDPKIVVVELQTQKLKIIDNLIENRVADSNIEITADGTGRVEFVTPLVNVNGSLHATGNITFDGDVILGSNNSDNVIFNSDIASSLISDTTDTYDIGSPTRIWKTLYADDVIAETSITATSVVVNNISLLLTQGNTIYVSVNGSDTNTGEHLHSTFKTIKHALSVAQSGDEIVVFPGDYEEIFPLTVPQGVSVKGSSIRAVTVKPTPATKNKDAFLLNGETTVSHITVKDFSYNEVNNEGYGFRFAPNASVTSRSPYVQNITVITQEISGTLTPSQITAGPSPTLFGFTSDSVTVDKSSYSQALVDSLVGQIAVVDRYPNSPLIRTVVSIETEPSNSNLWRINFDAAFPSSGWLKPISFYVSFPPNSIITNDIWDTTGSSVGEKWVAYFKSNLPVGFETTVGPGWTINVAGQTYIVDYVIQDPVNSNQWRIYVTTSLVGGTGIPIFSPPTISAPVLAGRGALVDGSVVNSNSKEASMLFYSVTFIVPNAEGINVTNGARVEWLNSFTYYASKGIHLTDGVEGFAGLGLKFGAEMRSINSANVYGEYGAVADGANTLGYLIGHNFGYVGSGLNNLNDRRLAIQANEIVAINDGKLYYDSMDHKGDYRIGDIFYVNQETGDVTFNAQAIDFTSQGSISLEGADGFSFVNASYIQSDNIRIFDNNIISVAGPVDISAISGFTYLNTDVNVTGSISVSGNTVIKGTVFLGNTEFDLISLTPNLTQDIVPGTTGFTLGKNDLINPKFWNTLYLDLLDVDAVVEIDNNTITTLTTNTDLVLSADGTGKINVQTTNVDIDNKLDVSGLTSLKDVGITGDVDHVGNVIQDGNTERIGNTDIAGSLSVLSSPTITSQVQFQNIKADNDTISATVLNSDLIFVADGTGLVTVESSDVTITNDVTIDLNSTLNNVEVTTTVTGDVFDVSDVYITDNYITTLGTDQNLLLEADTSGLIFVPLNDVLISNKLSVNDLTSIKNIDVIGNITHLGDVYQTGLVDRIGNTNITGNLTVTEVVKFDDVEFNANTLKTTLLDNDLEFRASGAGIVKTIASDVTIENTLFVPSVAHLDTLEVTTTVTGDVFDVSNVYVTDNYITTLGTDQNLLLEADGTGTIYVPSTNVLISNKLSVNNLTTVTNVDVIGNIVYEGDTVQVGNVDRIGDTDVTGLLTVKSTLANPSTVNLGSILIDENQVTTTVLNTNLTLYADGTGIVFVPLNDVEIENNLIVDGTAYLNNLNVTTTVTSDIFDVSDVYITDNYITTLSTNQNLLLEAVDDLIRVELNNVEISNNLAVNSLATIKNLNVTGNILLDGDVYQTGSVDRIGNTDITGNLTVTEVVKFDDVEFNANTVKTTLTNSDLTFVAAGTGVVKSSLYDVTIDNNLTVDQTGYFNTVNTTTSTSADVFDISDVYITDNYITTLGADQNLILSANGTGKIYAPLKSVLIDNNLTVNDLIVNANTSVKNVEINGNILQTGNLNQTGNTEVIGTFANNNVIANGLTSYLEVTSLKVNGNQIISTATNADLVLSANGTGNVLLNNWLRISSNEITNIRTAPANNTQRSIIFEPNGTGSVKIDSVRAISIPVGNQTTRALSANGEIRFNNNTSLFEGYQSTGIVSLYGVYDQDRNTFITPELTQGANDNVLRFVINNSLRASIDTTAFKTENLHIDNVRITANCISSLNQTSNITFPTNGTTQVFLNGVSFSDSSIINNLNSALTVQHLGTGYLKIAGKGFVIPSGEIIDRRGTPEVGELRNNTELDYVEVWNGTQWTPAIGVSANATLQEIGEIADEWSLILG